MRMLPCPEILLIIELYKNDYKTNKMSYMCSVQHKINEQNSKNFVKINKWHDFTEI